MSHNPCQKRSESFDVVSRNNLRLRVRRWGEGRAAVVLLHGFGDNAEVWKDFAMWMPSDLCAIAPDLRGHGDSQWDPNGMYTHKEIADDVNDVLEAIGARGVVLVGHSFGAAVSIEVARMRSDVRGLVIVDFSPFLNSSALEYTRQEFIRRMREFDSVEAYAQLLENHLPLVDLATIRRLAHGSVRTTKSPAVRPKCDPALEGISPQRVAEEAWPSLQQLRCPKLIVRGMCSAFVSVNAIAHMAEHLSNCAVASVPQAGHAVMIDNPSGFFTTVYPFIRHHAR